jgi:hypothetical protein
MVEFTCSGFYNLALIDKGFKTGEEVGDALAINVGERVKGNKIDQITESEEFGTFFSKF